jgi:hypothetical protein
MICYVFYSHFIVTNIVCVDTISCCFHVFFLAQHMSLINCKCIILLQVTKVGMHSLKIYTWIIYLCICSYYVQRRMILQYKISLFPCMCLNHLLYLLAQQKQMLPLVTEKYQVNLFYSPRPFYYPFITRNAWFDCLRFFI